MAALETNGSVRVLAADSQPLFRDAVARAVRQHAGLQLVGEAADGRAALEAIARLSPHVAVLDLAMPLLDGERVLRAIQREALPTRVLLLGASIPSETAYRAFACGAAGCVTRDVDAPELCRAILAVAAGKAFIAPGVQPGLLRAIRLRSPYEGPGLTEREREVLRRIAEGQSVPAIAVAMRLSSATIKTHLTHLYEKLGVSERAAAVASAMRAGLLE